VACQDVAITIIELVLKRRVSRLVVALEIIVSVVALPFIIVYALTRLGWLNPPLPRIIAMCAAMPLIRLYTRELRLKAARPQIDDRSVR